MCVWDTVFPISDLDLRDSVDLHPHTECIQDNKKLSKVLAKSSEGLIDWGIRGLRNLGFGKGLGEIGVFWEKGWKEWTQNTKIQIGS